MRVVWDMETGDPDDFLTLLWLCDHPAVDLGVLAHVEGGEVKAEGLDPAQQVARVTNAIDGTVTGWQPGR